VALFVFDDLFVHFVHCSTSPLRRQTGNAIVPSARREYGHNRPAHSSTASQGGMECFVAYSWSAC
jgi:hypothetical protein